jgi:hypothetical protein
VIRRATVKPLVDPKSTQSQFVETDIELGDRHLDHDPPIQLDLRVDEGASISGVVVDADGGAPICGARVSAPWWQHDWSDWSAVTDIEGRFKISGIRREVAEAHGTSDLLASAPGYVRRRLDVPPPDEGLDIDGLRIELSKGIVATVAVAFTDPPNPFSLEAWLYRRADDASGAVRRLEFLERGEPIAIEAGLAYQFAAIPPSREVCIDVDGIVPPLTLRGLDLAAERATFELSAPDCDEIDVAPAVGDAEKISAAAGTRLSIPNERWDSILAWQRQMPAEFARSIGREHVLMSREASIDLLSFTAVRFADRRCCKASGAITRDPSSPSPAHRASMTIPLHWSPAGALDSTAPSAEALDWGNGIRLALTVTISDGQVLASRRVCVSDLVGEGGLEGTTDDHGRVGLSLDLGRRFLRVRVAGYETENLEVIATEPGTLSYTLALRRCGG